MPFIVQLVSGEASPSMVTMYHIIQPSGSRVEVPPLTEQDAQELAVWLNVTAECAQQDDVEPAE